MQPDTSLPQDENPVPQEYEPAPVALEQDSAPTPSEKAPRKFNLTLIMLAVFVLIAIGLGVWNSQLNKALSTAKQNYADLDLQYRTVLAEKETLSADLDVATSDLQFLDDDLAATNATLANVKADQEKANQAIAAAEKKMKDAYPYVDFIRALFEDGITDAEAVEMAEELGDSKLEDLTNALMDNFDYEKTWVPFLDYILSTAMGILKK